MMAELLVPSGSGSDTPEALPTPACNLLDADRDPPDICRAHPQPTPARHTFGFWPTTHPHLLELTIIYLPQAGRLALRSTSRSFQYAVDTAYARNLTLTPTGALAPAGRIPFKLASRPELWPHTRLLDLSPLIHPLSSVNDDALSTLPPLNSLWGLQAVRTAAEKALPRHELPDNVVRVLDITPTNPTGNAPWRIPARPLHPDTRRLVLHIRCKTSTDLTHAQLSPRFWTFPPGLQEIVLHVRPHPSAPVPTSSPEQRMRMVVDNGYEKWARLMGLARVFVAAPWVKVKLVNTTKWPATWIMDHGVEVGFEAAWCTACVGILMEEGVRVLAARERVKAQFTFPSDETYRREVGERVWRLETVGRFSDLGEGEGWV